MDDHTDIAIVGGGLVGASLAVALADSPWSVTMIEAAAPPAAPPAWDERCIALNDSSVRIFERLGVWSLLRAEAEPILATHISEQGRFGTARFSAADAGLQALGWNVPLRAIGAALMQRLATQPRVQLLRPARVTDLAIDGATAGLRIETAEGLRSLHTRLVVAADGATSAVRERLGLGAQVRDYGQHAIVSAVRLSKPHRGVAYERFTADGPLALIPKPGDTASLVWTQPSAQVDARMKMSDDAYIAEVQAILGGRVGRLLALGTRSAWPLKRTVADALTAPRTVFIGNAAQSLHPVAAQGFNLGLRDVAQLARALDGTADPGADAVLQAHAAARADDRARVAGLTDTMVRTFSNRVPGLSQLRHWGLVAVDLLPGLRESVMASHLGHRGLPKAVTT